MMIGVNFQTNAAATPFNGKEDRKNCPSSINSLPMRDEDAPVDDSKKLVVNETKEKDTKTAESELKQVILMERKSNDEAVATAIESGTKYFKVIESEICEVKKFIAIESGTKKDTAMKEVILKRKELDTKKETLLQKEIAVKEEIEIPSLTMDRHINKNYIECSAMLSLSESVAYDIEEIKAKKRKTDDKVVSNRSDKSNDVIAYFKSSSRKDQLNLVSIKNKINLTEIDNCQSSSAIVQKCLKVSNNLDVELKSSGSDDQDLMKDASLLHSFKSLLENSAKLQPLVKNVEFLSKKSASSMAANDFCLVPEIEDSQKMSDYNNLLTQSIQIFLVDISDQHHQHYSSSEITSYITTATLANTDQQRIGLRCIHCASKEHRIHGATFFPKNIASLSSGMGTVCARHILADKCPYAPTSLVEKLRASKKASQSQTRKRGMCLDFYCKDILTRNLELINYNGIKKNSLSASPNNGGKQSLFQITQTQIQKEKNELKEDISHSYQPSSIENFWECKNCISLPYPLRASGSVIYSDTIPSKDLIQKHLNVCQGREPLRIPRTASIHILDDDYKKIRIKWDGSDYRNPGLSNQPSREDKKLVIAADKAFTTDFAYFTFLQLKMTHLSKTGGSRGSCPVGYPGLACVHCSNMPNERKFFYTSSDHLRNSFSHIPSHLMECAMCPEHVKSKLECLKALRNKQKSQLKLGSHKKFIECVWERIHGSSLSRKDDVRQHGLLNGNSETLREEAQNIISANKMDYSRDRMSANNDLTSTSDGSTQLVSSEDRHLVTEFTYFTMQQMIPCCLRASGNGARSAFDVGFPGLECRHCSNAASARRFFYRTSDILAGNYAHIPNHLLVCKSCPADVKAKLEAKKTCHLQQKMKLGRGSQRIFFGRIWERLHGTKKSNANSSASATYCHESLTNIQHLDDVFNGV